MVATSKANSASGDALVRRLIRELLQLWDRDWDQANYVGDILPQLMSDRSKALPRERQLLDGIREACSESEWNLLPQAVEHEHFLVQIAKCVMPDIEKDLRAFQLERAEARFQEYREAVEIEWYRTCRAEAIAGRKRVINSDLDVGEFHTARQLAVHSCAQLLPEERMRFTEWFDGELRDAAKTFVHECVVPLIIDQKIDDARRIYQRVAEYLPEQDLEELITQFRDHRRSQRRMALAAHLLRPGEKPAHWGAREVRAEADRRGIPFVVHFTRLANLPGIIERGLVPRHSLDEWRIPYSPNDELRLDGRKKHNCVSISFPNYRMFYKYRRASACDWVVLKLETGILWEAKCMYCKCNAASAVVRGHSDYSLMNPEAFSGLFEEHLDLASRAELGIPDCCTTDPQAEVLVSGVIHPSLIIGVATESARAMNQVREMVCDTSVEVTVDTALFGPRCDHSFWSPRWDDGD